VTSAVGVETKLLELGEPADKHFVDSSSAAAARGTVLLSGVSTPGPELQNCLEVLRILIVSNFRASITPPALIFQVCSLTK
jgi:hypothetical protein